MFMPNCMLVCTVLLLDAILMELVIGKAHIHTHTPLLTLLLWKCPETYYGSPIWWFSDWPYKSIGKYKHKHRKQSNFGVHLENNGCHLWFTSWLGFLYGSLIAKDDFYQVSRLYHQLNNSPKILLLTRTRPLQRPLLGNWYKNTHTPSEQHFRPPGQKLWHKRVG